MHPEKKWCFLIAKQCEKTFSKLDRSIQQRIISHFEKKVLKDVNPRRLGKQLTGQLKDLWRFRVGDYRVLTQIQDEQLIILAIHVGHRRDVYEFDPNR